MGTLPASAAPEKPRQRRVPGGFRPGNHELKDLSRWPAEPPTPPGSPDPARFAAALGDLCREMVPARALPGLAHAVLDAAAKESVDPFLLGALVYRESRCDGKLATPFGVGLLQIQPAMYLSSTVPLPFARGALNPERLKKPEHNLAVGAALLRLWQGEHPRVDERFPGAAHRTALAHFIWGDRVRGSGGEDRALVARRRFIERYQDRPAAPRASSLGIAIVSPLDGTPRVAPSGPGEDRDGGERAHRGLDIDATTGEPVRAIADGIVWFTGADMPGRTRPEVVQPEALPGYARVGLGPGGLFVCVRHREGGGGAPAGAAGAPGDAPEDAARGPDASNAAPRPADASPARDGRKAVPGIFSCYFHLSSYKVTINQRVKAGEEIAAVGRSGVKASGSHLHLEVHVGGKAVDPAPILGDELVIPPQATIAHELALASKKHRLKLERRARRRERLEARRQSQHGA